MIKFEKEKFLNYYSQVADKMLPFLQNRRVAMRQLFSGQAIFRRHDEEGRWIYIKTKEELLFWVNQHAVEFFPHFVGKGDTWFACDLDKREIPLHLAQFAAYHLAKILEGAKIEFLLKFSGSRGFHFMWTFGRIKRTNLPGYRLWEFERDIIRKIQKELEKRLQTSNRKEEFYRYIPKGDPITERNAADPQAQQSLLLDELILKRMATIRAPYSLHLKTGLTSFPLRPKELLRFRQEDASIEKALADQRKIIMPKNSLEALKKFLS